MRQPEEQPIEQPPSDTAIRLILEWLSVRAKQWPTPPLLESCSFPPPSRCAHYFIGQCYFCQQQRLLALLTLELEDTRREMEGKWIPLATRAPIRFPFRAIPIWKLIRFRYEQRDGPLRYELLLLLLSRLTYWLLEKRRECRARARFLRKLPGE